MEQGYSTLTRRERLERIATAERDRRAGRVEVAIAAIGDAAEWPARAVLALARLPESETAETRRILEEGLDLWASEAGLAALDGCAEEIDSSTPEESAALVRDDSMEAPASELDRPIDHGELERAFEEAEAQTDEMVGANDVAERILMQEPVGLAELDGDSIDTLEDGASEFETDAASAPPVTALPLADSPEEREGSDPDRGRIVATLERWLQNLEGRHTGRAQ